MSIVKTDEKVLQSAGLFESIQADLEIEEFIKLSDEHISVIGYTEHGLRHANRVSKWSGMVLKELAHDETEVDLARISGYLHDIANFICRTNHGQTGAALLYPILKRYPLSNRNLGIVLSAVGNHEESYGQVFNNVCAAVVLADKSDVHRSRVRNYNPNKRDIHDDVNHAVTSSRLEVDAEKRDIHLILEIDTEIATVMNYFQIFLGRMEMCRSAATFLGCTFHLWVNGVIVG
jgi:metal-dependent HD superfamily phosphatase/phosphodiesterase